MALFVVKRLGKPHLPQHLDYEPPLWSSPAAPVFCPSYHLSYRSSGVVLRWGLKSWRRWQTWPYTEHRWSHDTADWRSSQTPGSDGNLWARTWEKKNFYLMICQMKPVNKQLSLQQNSPCWYIGGKWNTLVDECQRCGSSNVLPLCWSCPSWKKKIIRTIYTFL